MDTSTIGLSASKLSQSKSKASAGILIKKASSFALIKDGTSSIEQHISLLVEDLLKYGSQSSVSASEDLVLREAFLGLHYLWRMRIHENLNKLNPDLMERLRQALLLFMGRAILRGPRFLPRSRIPTREAVVAFIIFCGMLRDVGSFREAINTNMTIADLRRQLAIHQWLATTDIEEDEEEPTSAKTAADYHQTHAVSWSALRISLEDVRRVAVTTTLFLAQVLDSCNEWKELVETEGYAAFEKLQREDRLNAGPEAKPLLAPKGEYWDISIEKVLRMFRTRLQEGLMEADVVARRQIYGDNRTPPVAHASLFHILFRQLADLIVLILIAATIVSAALGDFKTVIVLLIVITINTVIGFYQEWNAERAISALASLSVPQCTVIREGKTKMIDAGDLVPGDIVVLEEGSAVPADIRLCSVAQLAIIETLLTGESVPVEKTSDAIHGHRRVSIGDRINMAFQSTVVSRGRGVGVVVNTGKTTEIGRISTAIAATSIGKTPLQKKLGVLGKQLVVMALVACALVVVAGIAWNPKDTSIIEVGVSLALSVIPEGLVAIVTLTMALGMKRMAAGNALVRQLPAVETLGSVTTVCSDKTGTITEGVMRARLLWCPHGQLLVPTTTNTSSEAAAAAGPLGVVQVECRPSQVSMALSLHSKKTTTENNSHETPSSASASIKQQMMEEMSQKNLVWHWQLAVMAVCNNSTLQRNASTGAVMGGLGDQTEVALKVLAAESKIDWPEHYFKREAEIAFDSDRKRMSVICTLPSTTEKDEAAAGGVGAAGKIPELLEKQVRQQQQHKAPSSLVVLSKGAPEVVVGLCTQWMDQDGSLYDMKSEKYQEIDNWCDAFSAQGLRTLALAVRFWSSPQKDKKQQLYDEQEEVEHSLIFVGLVALADPPRAGIEGSIRACHGAGIRVVMITGDHIRTATSIAKTIGILSSNDLENGALVVNGSALSSMTVEQLAGLHPFPVVFSRVSPDNKLNIVKALQLRGEVVAMTGDGVNDAPAIRQADVGVAMGHSGTDITRQAADIILADDNFSTIVVAVAEGRKIYDNIMKFIVYLLSCNLSEVILMLIAVAAGYEAPLNALQILYANIVVDIPPSLALGTEDIEPDAMLRSPRNPKKAILGKRYIIALLVQATSIGLLAFISYVIALDVEHLSEEAAQSETFAVLFLMQCAHAFMSRSIRNSWVTNGTKELFFGNRWLFYGCTFSVMAVIAGIYIPKFNHVFGLVPIDGRAWIKIIVAIIVHCTVVEIGKWRIRRVKSKSVTVVLPPASPMNISSKSYHLDLKTPISAAGETRQAYSV